MPDALIGCGRETGIRTLGTLAGTTDFESVPFDHSGTSPHLAIYISGTYLILASESCSDDLELSTHGNRMKYPQIRNVYPNVSKLIKITLCYSFSYSSNESFL